MKAPTAIKDLKLIRHRLKEYDENRVARLRTAKENKDFRTTVKLWADEKLKPRILDEKQRKAVFLMCDFTRNYSYGRIAAMLGISEGTLINWRNDPLFLRELDKEITRRKTYIRLYAMRNVNRAVMRGDMKATWNYLKMTGDLREVVEIEDNTGEKVMSDSELQDEITNLQKQLAEANVPTAN